MLEAIPAVEIYLEGCNSNYYSAHIAGLLVAAVRAATIAVAVEMLKTITMLGITPSLLILSLQAIIATATLLETLEL